jgi:hypothetical protein
MTQEDNELLLIDLCGRLLYGVIVDYSHNAFDVRKGNYVKHGSKCILNCYLLDAFMSPRQNEKGEYIKPYLRPMSSMTKVEMLEYISLKEDIIACDDITYSFETYESIDWLNKKMFDYRGLIPKGLAIEVTKENNPYANN